jgi:predicted metal-dependent phosphoesterase TrpH
MSPSEVVVEAASRGLQVISITDHDTTDGLEEALEAGRRHRMTVIPGVEISSTDPQEEVHILGYYMDFRAPGFQKFLEGPRLARPKRIIEMCEMIARLGMNVSPEEVFDEAGGIESVGRPHLAKVMLRKGYVSSMDEAFDRFLANGTPGYVKRFKNTVDKTLEVVHAYYGISVIAHPGLLKDQAVIPNLVDKGVMGIEVYCHEHSQSMVKRFLQIAKQANLLVTGGSDYHGDMLEKPFHLGDLKVPSSCYKALEKAAKKIR